MRRLPDHKGFAIYLHNREEDTMKVVIVSKGNRYSKVTVKSTDIETVDEKKLIQFVYTLIEDMIERFEEDSVAENTT